MQIVSAAVGSAEGLTQAISHPKGTAAYHVGYGLGEWLSTKQAIQSIPSCTGSQKFSRLGLMNPVCRCLLVDSSPTFVSWPYRLPISR